MSRINTARLIAAVVNENVGDGVDPGEALQEAIENHLPGASDDYKANVYALVLDCWTDDALTQFCVARSMELAD